MSEIDDHSAHRVSQTYVDLTHHNIYRKTFQKEKARAYFGDRIPIKILRRQCFDVQDVTTTAIWLH